MVVVPLKADDGSVTTLLQVKVLLAVVVPPPSRTAQTNEGNDVIAVIVPCALVVTLGASYVAAVMGAV